MLMSNSALKSTVISLGIYKPVRFFYDHVIRRGHLAEMKHICGAFSKLVKAGDLCFDIGANIGQKSEAMLRVGARVVAVEPQPRCAAEMKARCGGYPGFVAVNKAVGHEPGHIKMHISQMEVFSSMHPDWNTHQENAKQVQNIEVEVTTLDQLVAAYGVPDFCKIDVEGFELEVFGGLTRPLKLLSFEFHNLDQPAFLPIAYQCLEHLSRLGEIHVNVSLGEDMTLLLDKYLPHAEFLAFFNDLITRPDTVYGDIYVRFQP
jgi:FkbM family methyltransferase